MYKIVLIQTWIGKIPDYFWFHYETTKNIKNIDFLFFTDQDLFVDSPNYKIIKTNVETIEYLLSRSLNTQIKFKGNSNYKISDIKASYGDIFRDFIKDYDYFGFYDLDTLFGDVSKYVNPFLGEYDVITIADEKYHNRISGPFTILKNQEDLKTIYRCNEFIQTLDSEETLSYEEHGMNETLKEKYKIKFIYQNSCDTENGGKNIYTCYWSGGKNFIKNEERFIYHFYRKKHTKLYKLANSIIAQYNKLIIDDFYWVVAFTQNYEKLFLNLLKSIKKYSNRKCIIYSINYNYVPPFEYITDEQFITRRIDIPEGDKDIRGRDNNIISCKPMINLDVINQFPGKKFVAIDSDIYFTVNSDDISKFFKELENYPLINSHIHDVIYLSGINEHEEWTSCLEVLLGEMGVSNYVVPRRKTNVMIYDERSEWFFKEQMSLYNQYRGTKPGILALHDEDTANAVLSKYELKKCLPLLDIEEVIDIDMGIFHRYSYHMTPISPSVIIPQNKNEVLFFHGIKSQEHYNNIMINYDNTVLECEEFCMSYKNNTFLMEKNSFLTTKKIPDVVNFIVMDDKNNIVLTLNNQFIKYYFLFYISDVYLLPGNYNIKIISSEDGTCIYKDILNVI